MAAPYNKLRSKLNRAIVAWLVQQGAGTNADVSPANAMGAQAYPNTTVRATLSRPEVALTGLRRISVHISIKGSAMRVPGETASAADGRARAAFDTRVANTYDALMQTSDQQTLRATATGITAAGRALAVSDPANNADMADFTCQGWYDSGEGDGMADEQGCDWEEILMFEALCSASNVD